MNKISIILPYKENFSPTYAGAVSLHVEHISQNSIYKKNIQVFGNTKYKKKFNLKSEAMSYEYKLKKDRLKRSILLNNSND